VTAWWLACRLAAWQSSCCWLLAGWQAGSGSLILAAFGFGFGFFGWLASVD